MPACCLVPNFPCTTLHVASPPTRSYGVMLIGMSQVSSMDVDFDKRGRWLFDRTSKLEVGSAGALWQIGGSRDFWLRAPDDPSLPASSPRLFMRVTLEVKPACSALHRHSCTHASHSLSPSSSHKSRGHRPTPSVTDGCAGRTWLRWRAPSFWWRRRGRTQFARSRSTQRALKLAPLRHLFRGM